MILSNKMRKTNYAASEQTKKKVEKEKAQKMLASTNDVFKLNEISFSFTESVLNQSNKINQRNIKRIPENRNKMIKEFKENENNSRLIRKTNYFHSTNNLPELVCLECFCKLDTIDYEETPLPKFISINENGEYYFPENYTYVERKEIVDVFDKNKNLVFSYNPIEKEDEKLIQYISNSQKKKFIN